MPDNNTKLDAYIRGEVSVFPTRPIIEVPKKERSISDFSIREIIKLESIKVNITTFDLAGLWISEKIEIVGKTAKMVFLFAKIINSLKTYTEEQTMFNWKNIAALIAAAIVSLIKWIFKVEVPDGVAEAVIAILIWVGGLFTPAPQNKKVDGT